jgi:hypothetical protein
MSGDLGGLRSKDWNGQAVRIWAKSDWSIKLMPESRYSIRRGGVPNPHPPGRENHSMMGLLCQKCFTVTSQPRIHKQICCFSPKAYKDWSHTAGRHCSMVPDSNRTYLNKSNCRCTKNPLKNLSWRSCRNASSVLPSRLFLTHANASNAVCL